MDSVDLMSMLELIWFDLVVRVLYLNLLRTIILAAVCSKFHFWDRLVNKNLVHHLHTVILFVSQYTFRLRKRLDFCRSWVSKNGSVRWELRWYYIPHDYILVVVVERKTLVYCLSLMYLTNWDQFWPLWCLVERMLGFCVVGVCKRVWW
jgi:hypothetical protein